MNLAIGKLVMHNVADTDLNATLSGKPHKSQFDNIKKQKLSLKCIIFRSTDFNIRIYF